MHKPKINMMLADDSYTYKISRRRYISKTTGKCSFCPPHGIENASKKQKSWKKQRKTQYK